MAANENLCVGPLNDSLCLQRSVSGRGSPSAFCRWWLSGYFLDSGVLGWGSELRVQTPHFSGGSYQLLNHPPALMPVGAWPALSSLHHTPYQSGCAEAGFLSVRGLWLLSLLFSYLFRVASPPLSCNSRLVLGEGRVAPTHSAANLPYRGDLSL